jgi:DNA-binding NtrC family response regulator
VAKILVLDEEQDSRSLVKRLLESNGHEAHVFCDEASALAAASSVAFDLAVLGSSRGREGPVRVIEELRAANAKMKVLTIDHQPGIEIRESEKETGILFKPVELDAMERKIEELLGPAAIEQDAG